MIDESHRLAGAVSETSFAQGTATEMENTMTPEDARSAQALEGYREGQRTQRIYLWCGPACLFLVCAGLLLAHMLPIPSPNLTPGQTAALFKHHVFATRVGLLIAMFGGALFGPWIATLSVQLRRHEDSASPAAYLQLALGALAVFEFILPLMFLESAAFRPHRPPAEIVSLDDSCWLMFVGLTFTFIVQMVAHGVAIVRDHVRPPLYPKWAGYLSLGMAAAAVPATFVVFFKTGLMAWGGLVGFWIPLTCFGIWILGLTFVMLRVVDRRTGAEQHGTGERARRAVREPTLSPV